MIKTVNFIKSHKIIMFFASVILLFALIIGIPSLAKFKHRNSIYSVSDWNGEIASSYNSGKGKKNDPYIISNASEFAYFIEQLKTQSYKGEYFELSNDIVINSGLFDYNSEEGLKYIINDITYYLNEENNEYYKTIDKNGSSIGKINALSSINNFQGVLDGNSFAIFGLYISDFQNEDLSIFKTLEGTLKNVYFSNSIVYGIGNVAGVAMNSVSATIENVSFNGFVINSSDSKKIENDLNSISVLSNKGETKTSIGLPNVTIPEGFKSIKLKGTWTGESGTVGSMKVQAGEKITELELDSENFEVDLGTTLLSEVFLLTTSNIDGNSIEFTNLKYVIEYYDQITSGIIGTSSNTTITNVINKSNVFGTYITSGLVGVAEDTLKIMQSYNTGNINFENIGAGLIGKINNNSSQITVEKSYNKGIVSASNIAGKPAGIIGVVENNTGLINLTGVVDLSNNYAINTITNSTVNISKCYSLNGLTVFDGTSSTQFERKEENELYTKQTLEPIGYNEFVSEDDLNISNVWVYEENSMPILYIDDLNNPVANLNINKLSWDNLSSELDVIEVPVNITFSIEGVSSVNPVVDKYYHVTNSRVPLTKAELDNFQEWKKYSEPVTIQESGYYTIYAKVIDSAGKTTYINTDIMMLNVSGFQKSITLDNNVWNEFKTDLSEVYVNKDMNITLFAHNDLVPVSSIEYYISDKVLTSKELKKIENWSPYTSAILIKEHGKYIVYAKITDAESTVSYINTDWLLYNGYNETLSIGNIGNNYETNYITNASTINLGFESNFELTFKEGYSHNLVSNILLPKGTKITLNDKVSNKVYGLKITSDEDLYGYNDSCKLKTNCVKHATYSFDLFSELGSNNKNKYDESINYEKTISNEKFAITIDFKETVLTDNYYDVSFYLGIKNEKSVDLYTTLNSTLANINIYSNVNDSKIVTTHKLMNDYSNQVINYNSNSETNINFSNQLIFPVVNDKAIIDTLIEKKKAGLLIGLYNSKNELVNRKYLNSFLFEVNEKEYYSNSNGIIKINLGSVSDNSIKTLKIKTRENSNSLPNDSYYLKINSFISDDGYYYDELYPNEVIIPISIESQVEIIPNYSFFVEMNKENLTLNKKLEKASVNFNIIYNGELSNPSVKVSLYEKKSLNAYNQEYNLVDLNEYANDELLEVSSKQYSAAIGNFNINLIPNRFNYNGYKYVFELYDGTKKVEEVHKYFIVR